MALLFYILLISYRVIHAHAKVVAKSWFRYGRVLFNFPYSKFFAATSPAGTFYRTARSLLVRAQMMVHGMSSCSSCSAWCRAGRGESVRTCLMISFPRYHARRRAHGHMRVRAIYSLSLLISFALTSTVRQLERPWAQN